MRDARVDFDLCDCAGQFGDESNFMRCSQGVQLEDFVLFDEILAPVLVTVVAVRVGFRVARKGAYRFDDAFEFVVEGVGRGLLVFVLECPQQGRSNCALLVLIPFVGIFRIVIHDGVLGNKLGDNAVEVEVELFVELSMAAAVSFGVEKREVVHVYLAASAFSFAVAREQPEQVVFLAVFSFLFSCCCPDSQVLDVLDNCGEGLPVSLVEHVLVDGRKACMIVLAHLVDVNRWVGWSIEGCFPFRPFIYF